MNDDFNDNSESGLSRNAKIAIGVGVGVLVIGAVVAIVLFARGRGALHGTRAGQQVGTVGAGSASGSTGTNAEGREPTIWDAELRAAQDYASAHPYVIDDSKIEYDVEQAMTAKEKNAMGYSSEIDIRFKYVKGGSDPNHPVPIRLITKIPETTQPISPPPTGKKSASMEKKTP